MTKCLAQHSSAVPKRSPLGLDETAKPSKRPSNEARSDEHSQKVWVTEAKSDAGATDWEGITAEDVARIPYPGTSLPMNVAWSTDDSVVTFLHSESGQPSRQLWALRLPRAGGAVTRAAASQAQRFVTLPSQGDTEDALSTKEGLLQERRRNSYAVSHSFRPDLRHIFFAQ